MTISVMVASKIATWITTKLYEVRRRNAKILLFKITIIINKLSLDVDDILKRCDALHIIRVVRRLNGSYLLVCSVRCAK